MSGRKKKEINIESNEYQQQKKQIMMEIIELFNIFKIVRHIDNKNEITDNTTFNYKKSKNV